MSSHINPDSGTLVIESTNTLNVGASPVDPVGAALHIKGGHYTSGNMYVGGTLLVNGDVISLGNGGGSLAINANISSHVLPNTSSGIIYNLGSNIHPWNILHVQKSITVKQLATNSASLNTSGTVYIDGSTSTSIALDDGLEGERKTIVVVATPSSTVVVTPNTANGFSTISFTTAGQSIDLIYTSSGWSILSVYGSSIA